MDKVITVSLGRKLLVGCLLIALTIGISVRLVYLHILEEPFLKAKGDALTQRSISLAPHRGMILDRNGQALAVSTSVKSIWVNAKQANLQDRNWRRLEKYLQLPTHYLVKKKKQIKLFFFYSKLNYPPPSFSPSPFFFFFFKIFFFFFFFFFFFIFFFFFFFYKYFFFFFFIIYLIT